MDGVILICGVPVDIDRVKEMFTGTYEDFLVELNILTLEIYEYQKRKAIEKYMSDLMFKKRPFKTDFEQLFKDNINKNDVMDIDKANDIYLKTFKRRY